MPKRKHDLSISNADAPKREDDALRASEERYRILFESINEGFCIIEKIGGEADTPLDFRFVEVNPAFALQSGLSDVVGKTIRQVVPDEFEEWLLTYDDILRSGEPLRFERGLLSQGRVLELYAFRVADQTHRRVGVSFKDITERKRAEDQLRRNHDTFFNLIQNAPFGLYVVDSQFRLRQVSIASQKVFSQVRPLIGRDFEEVLRIVWAEPFASEAIARFRHTLETGEPYAAPNTTVLRNDISDIESYDWKIERISLPDGQFGVVCYFYDITERKKTEDALRESEAFKQSIFDSSPDCIKVLDLEGNLLLMPSGQELLGIEDITPFLNKLWVDFWEGEYRVAAQTALQVAAAGGTGRFVGFFRTLRGEPKWWDVVISPILDANGMPMRLLSVSRDVTERKQAEEAVRESEERYRNLFNLMDEGYCIIEVIFDEHEKPIDWRYLDVNPAFEKHNGMPDAAGRLMSEIAPDLEASWFEIFGNVALRGESIRVVNEAKALNRWFDLYAFRVGGRESRKVAVLFTDITERIKSEHALHQSLRELRAAESALRTTQAELSKEKAALADHVLLLQEKNQHLMVATLAAQTLAAEIETARAQMAHLAQHDALTDLPNRALLNDRLAQTILLAQRHGKQFALMFLDLDRFKHINDSMGHAMGDQLLQSVALRLMGCVRQSDTVSRQGGDEFVLLLSEIERAEDAAVTARKVLTALAAPHRIEQHDLHISVSVGISVYPDNGQNAETLVKTADTAMYSAKESGRNNYKFFEESMHVRAVHRQSIEGKLRQGLARQEFVLYYQPKVDFFSGTIVGVEALLRWQHPKRGLLLPAEFVPIAEDCGLILPIGRWVLREACRQAQVWLQKGLAPITIAVNTSALEFRALGFFENVRSTIEDTCMEPRNLELELTESVLMRDVGSTDSVLHALADLGVKLAIDDFGTGYSSLSYLRHFPIDTLKIDQSFVRGMINNSSDASIVSAVIGLGKNLKQRVIAEGVETIEQFEFLRALQCEEGQGYYFGRPLAPEALANLLQTGVSPALPH